MRCVMWRPTEHSCHQSPLLCCGGGCGSPCPVLSSVPVTASAPLCVPAPCSWPCGPNSGNNCSKYASFLKEPVIQLMNSKNNRACGTAAPHSSKTKVSWYAVKIRTKKPQLNVKDKSCFSSHLDINISAWKKLAKSISPTVNYREKSTEIKSHELNRIIKLHLQGNGHRRGYGGGRKEHVARE